MPDYNAKVEDVRALVNEYLDANEAIDRNELRIERLIAELGELDAETSKLTDRQVRITAHLAPLFDVDGRTIKVFRRGGTVAVSHDRDGMFLTVRQLHGVSSLVPPDARPRMFSDAELSEAAMHEAATSFRLPGRTATIRDSKPVDRAVLNVAAADQEAG